MTKKPGLPLDSPPDSVCIIRLSALGDVTHAVPVLRAIQEHWSETRVTWITASVEHQLLSLIDGVRFVVIDKRAGWSGIRKLRRELAGERFDVLMQMQTSARANFVGACVKADIKLGWDAGRARDLHSLFMSHAIPEAEREHQVQGHLSFARAIGLDASEPAWDLPVTTEASAFVRSHVPNDWPVLVISPSSSHPSRNWRADRYAAVADHAVEQLGMTVVLSGGPSDFEASIGEAIGSSMTNPSINLTGKSSLPQLVALLERADVVLSPDSGPAHLANAVGTPVLGLHASTWSLRSGPYHSLDICIDKFPEAAQRFRGRRPEELRWGTRIEDDGVMDLITVQEVIERLGSVIEHVPDE